MILSMTGFGRGTSESASRKFTAEIKSLNSKQLDFTMRAPSYLKEIEVISRNNVAKKLERGKTDLSITVDYLGNESSIKPNTALLKSYKAEFEKMGKELGLGEPEDWYALLLRLPEAMHTETVPLTEEDREACLQAIDSAVDSLTEYRESEGRKLYEFFVRKIENIRHLLKEVEPFEAERVPAIRARLEEQLSHLSSIDYDKGRLEQEMIFYIEKLDVNEEKLRLNTHLSYFLETMGSPDSKPDRGQGKKLGFIAQEMGREINTLGSKSNHAGMQRKVVEMKDELEQIKEQVLNVL